MTLVLLSGFAVLGGILTFVVSQFIAGLPHLVTQFIAGLAPHLAHPGG
ncbi:transmembrane protein [Mycobacterium tuberculosis variant africanum]|nr:transmembrane protein [Mycobacterium tuberculosis variant africanum]